MILRRELELKHAGTIGSGGSKSLTTHNVETVILTKSSPGVVRKPSERFMRRVVRAKSKASNSERIRVSDLVNKLAQARQNESLNESEIFNGYRPGSEPGG